MKSLKSKGRRPDALCLHFQILTASQLRASSRIARVRTKRSQSLSLARPTSMPESRAATSRRSVRQRPHTDDARLTQTESRFFSRKHDKAGKDLLFSRSNASSPTVAESEVSPGRKTPVSPERDTPVFTEFFPPAPIDLTDAQVPSRAPSSARSSTKPESVQVKPHPSFATLRTKSKTSTFGVCFCSTH